MGWQIRRVDVGHLYGPQHIISCSPVGRGVNERVDDMLIDASRLVQNEVGSKEHVEAAGESKVQM